MSSDVKPASQNIPVHSTSGLSPHTPRNTYPHVNYDSSVRYEPGSIAYTGKHDYYRSMSVGSMARAHPAMVNGVGQGICVALGGLCVGALCTNVLV